MTDSKTEDAGDSKVAIHVDTSIWTPTRTTPFHSVELTPLEAQDKKIWEEEKWGVFVVCFLTAAASLVMLFMVVIYAGPELNNSSYKFVSGAPLIVITNVLILASFLMGTCWNAFVIYKKELYAAAEACGVIFWLLVVTVMFLSAFTVGFTTFDTTDATPLFYISYIPAAVVVLMITCGVVYFAFAALFFIGLGVRDLGVEVRKCCRRGCCK